MKRNSKLLPICLASCLAVALITASGCQFLAKKAVEKKTGTKVETEEDTPLKKVDISDIADELIYPDAKAKSRTDITMPGMGKTAGATLETSDEFEEVESYYDQEPESAGWKQTMKMDEKKPYIYGFEKDNSWAQVQINVTGKKTTISVQYIKEKKTDS